MTCDLASIDGIRHEFRYSCVMKKLWAYFRVLHWCLWNYIQFVRIKTWLSFLLTDSKTFIFNVSIRNSKIIDRKLADRISRECNVSDCIVWKKTNLNEWQLRNGATFSYHARHEQPNDAQFTYISMFFSHNNKSAGKLESDRFDGWWPGRLLC